MSRRNIYNGPDSCYAIREGIYITTPGVTRRNFMQYVELLLRDLRRGWTYDHNCKRIPMTKDLFRKRLVYLIALARKHGASKETIKWMSKVVKRILEEVKKGRIPRIKARKPKARARRRVKALAIARAR